MKDLHHLYVECLDELDAIGIVYGNIKSITVNTRAKSRWGLCQKRKVVDLSSPTSVYEYDISISYRLMEDSVSDVAVKTTIIHEILHTCKNGHGHTGEWQKLANRVNSAYGYNIKRTTSAEEKGLKNIYTTPVYKYAVVCTHCGHEYRRAKMTSVIKNPENYRCSHCKGKLVRA
jgi:predicted SprT family Zn-dependent metalloprotease